jgi:hypothetical protein
MSVTIRRSAAQLLPVIGALLAAGPAAAQTPCFDPGSSRQAVYYAGPNNDISCVVDFTTGQSRSVVVGGQGTNFNGLSVLFEGEGSGGGLSIVVGSSTQGGDIEVFDCDATGEHCAQRGVAAVFSQVKGVALDTFGNIAAVNGSRILYVPRCAKGDPGCPASGYGPNNGPKVVTGLSQIADVRFVSNAIAAVAGAKYNPGDVLVLGPTQLRAYKSSDLASATLLPNGTLVANLPAGTTGTGLALFPKSGEALVTTSGGNVLVISRTGVPTSFTTISGQGVNATIGNNAATGDDPAQGAEVFITANNSGRVIRYVAKRSVTGSPDSPLVADSAFPAQIVSTGNPPYGVGNATLTDAAWTGAGTNVLVNPAAGYDLTFEKVNVSGFSDSRTYLIDQGELQLVTPVPPNEPYRILKGEQVGLPNGFERTIPSYVGCFMGPADACYYLVSVVETSADVFGSTQQHHFDEEPFGIQADCEELPQPRLFHATDDDDAAVVEGGSFADITTGCGSHIGRGGQFSLFLTGSDGRPLAQIVDDKLTNFSSALNGTNLAAGGLAPFIKKNTKGSLSRDLDKAISSWNRGNEEQAQSYLAAMVATVKSSLASFSRCVGSVCRNSPGEIIARAESASFMVCQAGGGSALDCGRELH